MRCLIISADEALSNKLSNVLRRGMKFDVATSFDEAVDMARAMRYGMYFIDMRLGVDVCRVIRRVSNDPVIFISPAYNEAEAVAGFNAGADDYLAKPFGEVELCSRVRAILRRCANRKDPIIDWIDEGTHTVVVDGEAIHLSKMEFDILMELASAGGNAVSKHAIIRDVWGMDSYATDDALKVRVAALRKKIGDDRIETVRGYGYRLVTQ